MRRRQAIALLGLSALWPLWSRAQSAPSAVDAVAEIGKRLGKPRLLRGNFLQRKSLTGFNRPLLSQGEFLFAPGQGVLWHTRTPFETWLRITPNSISERGADGPATHVSASIA